MKIVLFAKTPQNIGILPLITPFARIAPPNTMFPNLKIGSNPKIQ
jgi:hypothetical protein